MEVVFYVQGSLDSPYKVAFLKEGGNLKVSCQCRAGQFGTMCKHRLDIVVGSYGDVVPELSADVSKVKDLMEGTELESLVLEYVASDKELTALKKRHAGLKKNLAKIAGRG